MALLTGVLANLRSLDACVASMAQSSIVVPYEARIGQLFGTQLTTEALRMPAGLHRLDHPANDYVTTLVAERSIKNSEVLFAVLATFELIEDTVLERAETLGTPKIIDVFEKYGSRCLLITTYTKH